MYCEQAFWSLINIKQLVETIKAEPSASVFQDATRFNSLVPKNPSSP